MNSVTRTLILSLFVQLAMTVNHLLHAQLVLKFESISTAQGLSQNYVQSVFCDHKGFLWFGTWDGLNRYDGKQFKIFKVNPNQENSLTNNRIIHIWQDQQNTLWVKTNDGYIHYLVEETYEFITYPYYLKSLEERNSTITCFVESKKQEVLLGSSNSGMYYLTYDEASDRYKEHQYLNRGESTISDNRITFITTDKHDGIWIGTKRGLNNISQVELSKESPSFSNYWLEYHFTAAYQLDSMLLFGTKGNGIKTYESNIKRLDPYPKLFAELADKSITVIESPSTGRLFVGTEDHGLFIYDLNQSELSVNVLRDKTIRKIYIDSFGKTWVNTLEFGIYQLDTDLGSLQHYNLTGEDIMSTVDDERQFIYEDSKQNLWIALHGGGLAHYNRTSDSFEFYRNRSNDNTSISSDNVYCITEDQSGMLWVGTGSPNGGVNKVYSSNEAFQQVLLNNQIETGTENVVRAILIDTNEHIWLGTKSGDIYILNPNYEIQRKISQMPLEDGYSPGHNAYAMMQDKDGFIWIGTKGGGIFVTETSMNDPAFRYNDIRFHHYQYEPGDADALSSNLIYSILQDSNGSIWIGTFEAGLHLVTNRRASVLKCKKYNTINSSISSDKVRNLYEDHLHRLWITTDFGVNYIDLDHHTIDEPVIHPSLFDPRKAIGLSYNDVIHVYQDSRNDLWFGTSGGGINRLLNSDGDSLQFAHLTSHDGLINDVVYAIQEDQEGQIWFSTVQGISRYNPADSTFENFDQSNNLATDVFNENTCAITADGALLFGTNDGLLVVYPHKIQNEQFMPNVVFTNFQLFNKNVDIRDPDSPIKQDIETLDQIDLKYFQSSFSIDYAALSYYSPTKNKYAFMLENFDKNWNEVGNQNRATYTNLSPGEYIFKVKAANWNSDWSDKTRSILIIIHPPWWKTTTMYIVYFIVLVIIIEIIRRSSVRYHKLQNDLKVEKRVSDIKLQFFTNISHEIRTPLTLILGPIHDIMELQNIPQSIAGKLHLVEKNGKRMLRLVNQLLDFRKVQQGKMVLKVQKIELISFIKSIIENFDLVAQQKKVKILFQPEIQTQEVWVDPNKFDSVIFNILSNAIKFSPKDSEVILRTLHSDQQNIQITVSDQGSGIPRNRINQIFERFSPLAEENEEFGSSGIGLAYSYQIIKLHHGEISVKSEIDKGSSFTITIQKGCNHFNEEEILETEPKSLYQVKHAEIIEEDGEVEVTATVSQQAEKTLMIVEDNVEILNYLKENLSSEYHILTAHHGKEALEVIDKAMPDIIITDIMMPVMNGIELCKCLKESLDTSHIPIIMLTAKSSMEDQIEGVDSGAEAYILKPFTMSYVRAVIGNLIKQRSIIHDRYIKNKENGYKELNITSKDEKFLNDIMQHIMENYADPEFNIEKLVDCCYVSRTVFYHKIKTLTGLTPIDFLRQKRLSIAAQLIVQSDYNVSEIAYSTGFNDTKYFSRKFKAFFGMTPSEYKSMQRQEATN
jgi:signal transduction histidine kinase/ligand-binding sensor domain-containing protein/AraC-like DNA-binding protein